MSFLYDIYQNIKSQKWAILSICFLYFFVTRIISKTFHHFEDYFYHKYGEYFEATMNENISLKSKLKILDYELLKCKSGGSVGEFPIFGPFKDAEVIFSSDKLKKEEKSHKKYSFTESKG